MRPVVTGVEASGKSTVGWEVAARTGWLFLDGDDVHTPGAWPKMVWGQGLTDADRDPGLARRSARLKARPDVVLACSALRRGYRNTRRGSGARFLLLKGPEPPRRERVAARTGYNAGAARLPSPLAALGVAHV